MKEIKNLIYIFLLLPALFCQASGGSKLPGAHIADYLSAGDSIAVEGKVINSCNPSGGVKITEYKIEGSPFENVPVDANGAFTYRLFIKKPKQLAMRIGNIVYEFMVTPKEKVYHVEISCNKQGEDVVTIKNSNENMAFGPFNALGKTLMDSLDKFSKSNLYNEDTFRIVKKMLLDYQARISAIAKDNRGTYTADVLCPSEILPKSTFSSYPSFRENFLQRDIFAEPEYYDNALSTRVFIIYLSLLGKKDTSFAWFNKVMSIGLKNPAAVQPLEEIFYSLFYNRHEETLLVKYILWAEAHPKEMSNVRIKMRLESAKKTMPGTSFIDFQLKNPEGALKKLSETVSSAKLTLLIFYSPTCSHCREQLPKLMPLWEKYKDKGLKIHAVGYEASDDEWNDFINQKISPEWINVFEPEERDGPSIKYGVNYRPTFILINHEGKIISRYGNIDFILEELPEIMSTLN